jgi:hypothetical protein
MRAPDDGIPRTPEIIAAIPSAPSPPMNALVIRAHPLGQSFNAVLLERTLAGLARAAHDIELLDLYAEDFDPPMRAEERRTWSDSASVPPEIAARASRLRAAEGLVVVFPVWCSACLRSSGASFELLRRKRIFCGPLSVGDRRERKMNVSVHLQHSALDRCGQPVLMCADVMTHHVGQHVPHVPSLHVELAGDGIALADTAAVHAEPLHIDASLQQPPQRVHRSHRCGRRLGGRFHAVIEVTRRQIGEPLVLGDADVQLG